MEKLLIHLERGQKQALQRRVKETGRSVAGEIRQAIDLYLKAPNPTELTLLDELSKQAQPDIAAMQACLDRAIHKIDDTLDRLSRTARRGAA